MAAARETSPRPVVTVVGSYAVGLMMRVDRFPAAGETRIGSGFEQGPGGKGSNQAIQAARMGADVALVAAIGADAFADAALAMYADEGVDVTHVRRIEGAATGAGFVMVDGGGQNRIILDMGANELLRPADVDAASDRIARSGCVVTQLEIPLDAAVAAMRRGHAAGALTVLNPAPAQPVPADALPFIDVLTPNESELAILCGREPGDAVEPVELASTLIRDGARAVIVTLGEAGAIVVTAEGTLGVQAPRVDVVDTTGAGDAFTGTLATELARGADLEAAARRAAIAGSLACTRMGVVPALATAAELDAYEQGRAS